MDLVTLCGLPGVGKLTVARQLCAATGLRNFHNHLVVDAVSALFEFGTPPFVELRESLWMSLLGRAVAEQPSAGIVFTLAWDRTLAPDFLPRLRRVARDGGWGFHCVELVCARAEFERRLTAPNREGFTKLNSLQQFLELERQGAFPRPNLPEGALRLDTSELRPADAARIISEVLNLRLSRPEGR